MDIETINQIKKLLEQSQKIMVTSKEKPDGDSVGSMVAWSNVLNKLGKEVIMTLSEPIPDNLRFLPETKQVGIGLEQLNNFMIHLDIAKTQVEQLSYAAAGKSLHIAITPKGGGNFDPRDVTFSQDSFKPDLIFTLDCPDLNSLGRLYRDHAQLFFDSPVINIDHSTENEQFGKINLVEVTATSSSEIIALLVEKIDPEKKLLDKSTATALLTGIMYDTESFQSVHTTPRAFKIAADLVAAGADQQEITRHLYRTKPLSTLKLWGRVLARAKSDPQNKIVWSIVAKEDFEKSQAGHSELEGVTDEILTSAPEAEVFVLLYQINKDEVNGKIHAIRGGDAAKIASLFGGTGHRNFAEFKTKHKDLLEAEKIIVDKIREHQKITITPRFQQ